MSTFYEMLEVSPNASKEVIEMAYKAIAKKYDPDINPPEQREQLEEIMICMNEAKNVLTNDEERLAYDHYLYMLKLQSNSLHEENIEESENERVKNKEETKIKTVRPWVRYFARMTDMYLLLVLPYVLINAISGFIYYYTNLNFFSSDTPIDNFSYSFAGILTYCFIEIFLISTIGTTPGKFFYGISIKSYDGKNLSFKNSLIRNVWLSVEGLGLYIPHISFLAILLGYSNLKANSTTNWDLKSGAIVSHKKLNIFKIIISIILVLSIASLSYGLTDLIVYQK